MILLTSMPYLYWRIFGFLGIFFTASTSMFYGIFIIITLFNEFDIFYFIFIEFYSGALAGLIYFTVCVVSTVLITKKVFKKNMITHRQYALVLLGALLLNLLRFYPS